MSSKSLKTSVSRKPYSRLSRRQRDRISREIETNRRCFLSKLNRTNRRSVSASSDNLQDTIPGPVVEDHVRDNVSPVSRVTSPSSSSSSRCRTDIEAHTSSAEEVPFLQKLATCFTEINLPHTHGNKILQVLRTHPCFADFPKDVRSLLKTPRIPVPVISMPPGEYVHFGVESELVRYLDSVEAPELRELLLDFSTDGCVLDRASTIHVWPIQCRVVNLQINTAPIVVGIYKGVAKPYDPAEFFSRFVSDIKNIVSKGGIEFRNYLIPVRLRCFIADAPARAFMLNHRGHTSGHPCSKCKVIGTQVGSRYVFPTVLSESRTDDEYVRCVDRAHHKDGISVLSGLPMGLVTQIPFEYMHLVCLGVVKKLLLAWIGGKFQRNVKLNSGKIALISGRLRNLQLYCPSDFARRPRAIEQFPKYKATEFRQFLLYTGPVVLHNILPDETYIHFLFLHIAIRVLISHAPSEELLKFSETVLQRFVLRCPILYGPTFASYNVHGLLHLPNDVRRFGPLDSFSAFPYENNMSIFSKYCRKPHQFLQQFFNRMAELHSNTKLIPAVSSGVTSIRFRDTLLGTPERDNCCILHDSSICVIHDIVENNRGSKLLVKKFRDIRDFYNVGLRSSEVGVYHCSNLSGKVIPISLNEVRAKCYKMPFLEGRALPSNTGTYIVTEIVHSERIC